MTRLNTTAVDVAYNLLLNCKEGMAFKDLWQKVVNEMGYDEKIASRKISQFYTNLSLDGRFINYKIVMNLMKKSMTIIQKRKKSSKKMSIKPNEK